ncbi:MAG: hypothetical protein IJT70_08260 [Clostridia bacterium]|nr:hypothetical protein [Clostridia bacterium]
MNIKRLLSVIISLILVIPAVFTVFTAATGADEAVFSSASDIVPVKVYAENQIRGDLFLDGSITARDSRSLKSLLVGAVIETSRLTVDIDGNGIVNAKDSMALKKIIVGISDPIYYGNTTVAKSFDSDEEAMALETLEVNETDAFFDYPLPDTGIAYFAIVAKGTDGCTVSTADDQNEMADALSYETVEGNNYSAWVAELPNYSAGSCLEVRFDAQPVVGKTVFVDSVIFADTEAEALAAANARVEARAVSEGEEFKYVTVNFDSSAPLSRITSANHASATYDAGNNAMKLQVSGSSADPWVLLNFEDLAISADEYKYIVYKSKIPSNCNQPTPQGELFFAAGNIQVPTGGYSTIYSQFKDNTYHSSIFELTNAAFWQGTVHSIRFDFYTSCAVGDTQYVKSITFCNTYEAAAAICDDRTSPTTDINSIFFYGKFDNGSFKLSYRMYVPYDYDGVTEYPFLMLLHGAGERGTDGTYQLSGGFPKLFDNTSKSTFRNIVFVPQCPNDMKWVDCDWTAGSYSVNHTPESNPLSSAISVVMNAFNNYKIDRDRVYVSGLSMGGYGSWDVLTRHGDIFTAGVILCGGGDPSKASVLKDIPIRIYHGTADNIVPTRGSQQMYDAIVAAGGSRVYYTPLGGYDHMIWDHVYAQQWVFDWLYQQRISAR